MTNTIDGGSYNTIGERIEELKAIFPEAVVEGRLDYDTLMALLGDEFDNDHEKYRFEWKGKLDSLRMAQKRSMGTLRPYQAESVEWSGTENLYIEGDNLEVLKLLQQGYLRKVKMIYIDPPYNTGKDFVYEDNFADPIASYKAATGQSFRANPETAGRYHSRWLSMIYPRLKIAKTLLRDDGVIFISIDDNEVHNLRKLCDEVFGEQNFVASLVWESKYTVSNDAQFISNQHENILFYAKQKTYFQIGRLPRTDKQNDSYKNRDNDPKGAWKATPLHAKSGNESAKYTITFDNGYTWSCPQGRFPRYSKETLLRLFQNGEIYFNKNGGADKKTYLSEVEGKGIVPGSVVHYQDVGHTHANNEELSKLLGKGVFDNPKGITLIKRLLLLSNTQYTDIILDFFSGSGTTAHAVMQLNAEDGGNRKFIMVQIPEQCDEKSEAFKAGYANICEIGKERIRRAGAKVVSGQNANHCPDTGFRVFKLDTSNFKQWDESYAGQTELFDRMEDMLIPIKPNRSTLDVLYEIFLKCGIELTEKLAQIEVCGKTFYVVGETGYLFICIDKELTVEVVEAATEYTPGKMIFARDSFPDTNAITNTVQALEKRNIEFRWI